METMFWVWLAAALIFLILELTNASLFFICFVAGAVVAAFYSVFDGSAHYIQLGIFLVVTLGLLPLTRKLAKKITKESPQKSNADALVGKIGLVTKTIDPDLGGQIRVEGEIWIATSEQAIAEGTKVKITALSGAKLHVCMLEEGDN